MTTSEVARSAPHRRPAGRPRSAAADEAILKAAAELIAEVGVEGTTMSAVARRAAVARASIYLRWPSRNALIGAATKITVGGEPLQLSGDLAEDARRGGAFMAHVFAAPSFAPIVPELMRAVLAKPPELSFDALAPNRVRMTAEFERLAAAQGFDATIDPHVYFDALFGSAMSYLMARGTPPPAEYMRDVAEVLIRGLRRP